MLTIDFNVGMHAIKEKPVVVDGQIVIRPIMVVALTYDHRMLDGREAVTFLGESTGEEGGWLNLTTSNSADERVPRGPAEDATALSVAGSYSLLISPLIDYCSRETIFMVPLPE